MNILNEVCEPKQDSSESEFNKILANSTASSYNQHRRPEDRSGSNDRNGDEEKSIVTPFLTKHIANQIPRDNFHKFCYRHNPDVQCNKSSDEIKMQQIQKKLELLPRNDQEVISHVWSIFSAAPRQHRSLILQGLLSQCCFPQLSLISQEVSSLIKIDFISNLPYELSLKILCYLDCTSLCNAAQVSKRWKTLADDDRVWHHMCEQHIDRKCPNCGWGLPLMHMKKAREYNATLEKKRKIEEVEEPCKAVKRQRRPWKLVYSERFTVERNWRKGSYKIMNFKGHTDGVTCLQFNNDIMITGSYDTTLKIWNCHTGELIRTLKGHDKGVRSLLFDDQKLITGGLDSTIKIWNYHTGECISTYRGHEKSVSSVDFHNKTIVSGSADHTVKVWHVDSRTCFTLRGHTDWVNCVKIHHKSNTVFSASDDTTIRMWDLNSNECLRVFGSQSNGHVGQVQCVIPLSIKMEVTEDVGSGEDEEHELSLNGNEEDTEQEEMTPLPANPNYPTHLLTSSLDNTIKLWDVQSGKCIRTQFGHIEGVWSISADTFRIISGAHDRLVKIWDLQNGKCIHTFANNSESVSCCAIGDSRFAYGLENGEVKMYCFDDK